MGKMIKSHYKANTRQRCPMLDIDHKKGYVQGWQGCRLKLHQEY